MTAIHIAASTHTGLIRSSNEDAYGATGLGVSRVDGEVVWTRASAGSCLIVVADGLGGHPCGEVASQLAVDSLLRADVTDPASLVDATSEANRAIYSAMSLDEHSIGMGTTVAAVSISHESLAVVNVGDSTVMELVDDRLVQLTVDDVPAGRPSLPGVPSSTVTQTLGGERILTEVEPHLYLDEITQPRRLLLCTDGLTNFVPRDQLAGVLRDHRGEAAVTRLLGLALAAGGPDNVTAMAVELAPSNEGPASPTLSAC